MNSKVYKSCAVPLCKNTSLATPNKVFVHVPIKKKIRLTWLKLAWRNPDGLSLNSPLYFCEDHFDLPNDMENYMEYHVMGSVSQVRMKVGCMPKNFKCQPDRTTLTSDKTRRMKTLHKCEKRFEENSIVTEQSEEMASGSSVQHNVEEVPQLSPRVLDTSIQVKTFKAFRSKANETQITTLNSEIKEDFENKSLDDDILNLHTTIDIKQDIEDIDSSEANLSSASSSRTNSACGSPTRESHNETFTEYVPQTTLDVTVMKEEPESPLSDVSLHSTRDILTDVAADVYQQHTKKQSQQNKQLTQIRHANCERQRKYREKQRAAKLKARGSSEVQQHKRRPLTNAERTRKHRKILREKQQQQIGDINVITVLSNKNVDPAAHARNARKLHLNKLRQSRFRARQRFKSPSQQAQELVTQKIVDHNSRQDALEDLHVSDPSHSTDSCLQTIMRLKMKINKDLDLHESHEDILNLHTHVEIKQEDLEDIESSVANLSSASCCQTNIACSSPTRESRIETFTEYEPQTTIDVTVLKEEPGSPLPDVSIHSDAANPSEEEAMEIKLRKKTAMLSQNEEIIKCRREEISILKKNNKQFLADIKYLQDVSKKKF